MMRIRFLLALASCLAILPLASFASAQPGPTVSARLGSCDDAVRRAAADELMRDPKTLQEPLMIFHAASAMRMAGRKEEAAFLYLAARLRASRQILFEKGDRPQLLQIMQMTVGPLVMPSLMSDPALAKRVVKRVIEWDRATPDPFRERAEAKSGEMQAKLAEIDAGLARLPEQIKADPARSEKASLGEEQAERMVKMNRDERCGPGTLDAVDMEAATERIRKQAVDLAKSHPFVLERAGGSVKSADVGSWRQGANRLPSRLTVSVRPVAGETFYAEVDAAAAITPDRKLGPVKTTLACVTKLWIGQRDASWKDVCTGDPAALKPPSRGD